MVGNLIDGTGAEMAAGRQAIPDTSMSVDEALSLNTDHRLEDAFVGRGGAHQFRNDAA